MPSSVNKLAKGRPRIAGLLIDVSGTLHVGKTTTPGAVDAFHKLQESSIPFRLCSNTSKESTTSLVSRLDQLGFKGLSEERDSEEGTAQAQEKRREEQKPRLVWTSIGAVSKLIEEFGLKRPFLLLSDSARQEVLQGSTAQGDLQEGKTQYDSVVVGLAPSVFDYSHLNTAFRVLKRELPESAHPSNNSATPKLEIPLIATHKAKYIQTEDGLSLGPGPFVTALENASGITARVVGKPTKDFFEMVINDFTDGEMPTPDGKIVVIGDDVEADLGGGAVELGLWRVLVKTGKYRAGDESREGVIPPDEVFETFADFVEILCKDRHWPLHLTDGAPIRA
ncbi:HAD-like protein [Agrocybe pediades]|nr:HAD-like protein [Agrocybe pediades]